ncbi:hypothetical protein ECG_07183 [Echinococcus granulosus]|uniref:Expressed conserved protein n=1 Tax=Echinococcus granulosus TaxID=6210 RepID=U6JM55_ECHGR|nr:hypothetical protein EGR_04638 [Echinococcus granulosus]EUB60444.1 hypothetical protein EGR_04638 [Echinococcus granulosus]KAH9280636.1 hypothetical protein ECG_07183 [Echinococcus granulosus]CDS22845.1 expressed conserved protein [Echinococcus granulosus]
MLSNDLKNFLRSHTNCKFPDEADPYYLPIDPWNPNITQQIRHLTKASRRPQRLRFIPGKYLGDPEAIMRPFEEIIPPNSPMRLPPIPKRSPPEEKDSRIRQAAQEVAMAAVVVPLSKAMAEDTLPPLYDDAGHHDRYAGVPRNVRTLFFHEDAPRVRQVAQELVKNAVRRATYRVRRSRAVVCPWLGNSTPTFGLEPTYHST